VVQQLVSMVQQLADCIGQHGQQVRAMHCQRSSCLGWWW
jgi:hypothetical protein